VKRNEYAALISSRLENQKQYSKHFFESSGNIRYFYVDDLLPVDLVKEVYNSIPRKEDMVLQKSLKDFKYVAVQMDLYAPILEEILYAFQQENVLNITSEITGIKNLIPDETFYSGGISSMSKGCFLNPHLDNSHDRLRENYRVLNLLYYITPEWKDIYGGALELWPNGINGKQIKITSKFNRLVVMATNRSSLHSVDEVKVELNRCCVSNFYFSCTSLEQKDYYHSSSFLGRPGQRLLSLILTINASLRTFSRGILDPLFKKGIIKNPHFYEKN
jgi:Rps23 Pro-64 3,4-dihydroxylase Tpa1-like proline 4-hydroxylase